MKTLIMTLALVGSTVAANLPSEFDRDIYTSGEKYLIINVANAMLNQCQFHF